MAADVVETVTYQEDSASPLTVSKPASFASGQRLIFVISMDGGLLSALTVPSGWTAITGGTVDISSQRDKAYYHDFNAGDPSTWDFPYDAGSSVAGLLFRITGADLATAPTAVTGNTNSNLSTMDSPTITPFGSTDLLTCAYSNFGGGTVLSYAAPSGMTNLGSSQVTGNHQCIAGAKQQLVSGSATGAKTWTSLSPTGGPAGTFSIVVKSATAAAAVWLPTWVTHRRLPSVPRLPRGRASTPVRAQVNPPFPFAGVYQPRRLRGLGPRRGEAFVPVPAQVVVTAPAYPPQSVRARVKVALVRRGRAVTPPPAQAVAPLVSRIRVRVVRLVRSRTANVVPPQITVLPPAYPPQALRTRLRGLRLSRGRQATPVPPQVLVQPPAYPPVGLRDRVRGLRLARRGQSTPVPPQAAPVALAWVPLGVRERVRGALARLRRFVMAPPAQAAPSPARRTTKAAPRRKGRVAQVVPPQVVVPPPLYVPLPVHRQRFGRRRGSHGAEGWLVGASDQCTTPRPDTGATARPAAGTTVYNLAVTSRPSTGITARPDTGITEDPC
jgi:hypothetical protein